MEAKQQKEVQSNAAAGKESFADSTPSISLPKGGGAIRGIGEKFAANPVTGTGSMSVPIFTSPGRSGFGPQLSLSYDSGSGNGPFGFGWNLSLPAITRKTDKGLPQYRDAEASDVFILSGAEDLVPVRNTDGSVFEDERDGFRIHRYRPRIEGVFTRIECWTEISSGDVHWRSVSPTHLTTIYGKSSESRIADPADPARVFSWLTCESYDDTGNAIVYEYVPEDSTGIDVSRVSERNRAEAGRSANRYIKRIKYGNRISRLIEPDLSAANWLFEVVFDYDENHYELLPEVEGEDRRVHVSATAGNEWSVRPDPFSRYRAGYEVRTYRRCRRVLMFHRFDELGDQPYLVRSTEFDYADLDYGGTVDIQTELAHPGSTRFASFIRAVTQSGYIQEDIAPVTNDGAVYLTYRRQSLPPVEFEYTRARLREDVEHVAAENLPIGLEGANYRWVDLDGEGVSGILTEQAGTWFYKRNVSPLPQVDDEPAARFAPLERVARMPMPANLAGGQQFMDLDGDGQLDVVDFAAPVPGHFERTPGEDWETFRAFASIPNIAWTDPNLRFVDLTGDGLADIFITEDDVFVWHSSLAAEGFGPAKKVHTVLDEEKGPRAIFADGTQSIYLADMSADGLTDIVRIRNGEVCYWPNLGYGRFGAKVTMDNAPWFDAPDQFDQRRIRLADIDGSGVTDIIYLKRDGVQLYFNQSGNRWSEARPLAVFPDVNDVSDVTVVDLLGNGTACLVWSSPLPGDAAKPMRYVRLMEDKPHLLTKAVNNLGAETRVRYAPSTKFYLQDKAAGKPWITRLPFPVHVVEQVESFDRISRNRFTTRYAYHHGYFDGVEREFRGFAMIEQWDTEAFEDYVVGVAHVEGGQELAPELNQPPVLTRTWFHTGAYFDADRMLHQLRDEYYLGQQHLPEAELPADLDAQELRECMRALKGLSLRREIYSFDGSAQEQHPYMVSENRYGMRLVQHRGEGRHAVFLPLQRESVSLYYERNPADPRISHSFNLEIGPYGNVLKTAAVVYGRQIADVSLPAEVTEDQQRTYVSYTEIDYTDDIDSAAAYRLRVPYQSRDYEITGIAPAADLYTLEEIAGQIAGAADIAYEVIATGASAERRLLSHRRTVFLDDDLNALPLGQWGTLGLVGREFRLAFTPGVTAAHYAGQVSDADFTAAGYVHFDGDTNWWIPSGTAIYPADPDHHFYIPIGVQDPFGIQTIVTFDQYDLLSERVQVQQALWNEVIANNDYRVLGPVMMTDANKNRSVVELDALGTVVKVAVMGKQGASDGDTLADPTMRLEYDYFNWMKNGKPNFTRTLAHEQHGPANARWRESYTYSNGSGGVALVKTQAHPGKALQVDAEGNATEVDADPRWIGNGRSVLNNKGNPVKQYEPYFSVTHEYEDEQAVRELGVTALRYYDPIGRNIRVEYPNGTLTSIEFNPWMQRIFDANDKVIESRWYADRGGPDPAAEAEPADPERRAAWLAAKHAGTPGVVHLDSLGRTAYAISDYGGGKTAAARTQSDLTRRYFKLFDPAQREITGGFTAMTGAPIFAESAEKGRRWSFQNILGALVKTWDEHGREFRTEYDSLHRPISVFAREAGQEEILLSHVVYGDRHPGAASLNLLNTTHLVFDQAGMVRVPECDFKGNPKRAQRLLAKDYQNAIDWSALALIADYNAIQPAADPALETGEVFESSALYDALNRPTRVTLPDHTVIVPSYNEAGFLATLQAQIRGQGEFTTFLQEQDYDARGQRQFARYGNDIYTRYFYDPKSFRLTQLLSYPSGADPETQALQNLRYTYDPVGNVTQVRDDAQQTYYFNNAVVKPESLYEYDAIYQLIRASGREHAAATNDSIRQHGDLDAVPQLPHANDTHAVRRYTEEYEYDLLGNIKVLRHRVGASGWTRRYRYAYEDDPGNRTNRLSATSQPGHPDAGPYSATYDYDVYGNMTRLPHLADLDWNVMDQLRRVDLGGGGTAYHVYGTGGQRLRKVIDRNGTIQLDWIFLGAVMLFRRRRRDTGAIELERWTVHVSDDAGTIAQVDIKTADPDNSDPANPLESPLIRYQHANHLDSAAIETDDDGNVISYEEYHPYGTSAYRSAKPGFDLSLKRYRFSGKERDDESGFYYFGARYYAPWLGRWTSSDPAGLGGGANLFRYCTNNPVMRLDPNGQDDMNRRFGLPDYANVPESASAADIDRRAGRLQGYVHGLGYRWSRDGAANPNPVYSRDDNSWTFGTFSEIPEGDPLGILGADEPPGASAESAEGAPGAGGDDAGGSGSGGAPDIPLRPFLDPIPPTSPLPTNPIPRLDLPEAPPGTDFAREESGARAAYRARHGLTGRSVAVQHPAKWRDGARTNLHPRITNDPRFLHPISNVRGTGGTVGGRTYATEHTYADRGLYPRAAADMRSRYGSVATERVTHVWAGREVRGAITGSRGPTFLRDYIWAPMVRGAGGHLALAATRTFVPFVVEAELGLMGGGMLLYNAGYTSAGVAAFGAASYVPVVGGGLVAGAVVGNAAESVARELGASEPVAEGVGMLGAVGAGAGVGALIGSVIPGVGTAVGAGVGAVAGLVGYGLSKLF